MIAAFTALVWSHPAAAWLLAVMCVIGALSLHALRTGACTPREIITGAALFAAVFSFAICLIWTFT